MAVGATGTPTTEFAIPKYSTSGDAPNGTGFNSAMDFLDSLLMQAPMSSKIASLADGDVPIWDATTSRWVRPTGTPDGTKFLRDDGAWAAAVSDSGAFSTYAPTWAASGTQPVIGNGTLSGRYTQIGKLVVGTIAITAGSTTTFGTGLYTFTLPVTAQSGEIAALGGAFAIDASPAQVFVGMAERITTTTVQLVGTEVNPVTSIWGQTTPLTWANGDKLAVAFTYEAA